MLHLSFILARLIRTHGFLTRKDLRQLKQLRVNSSLGFLMASSETKVCVQAIATLSLPSRSHVLVVVPQRADLSAYQEALQQVLPGKVILASNDLKKNRGWWEADFYVAPIHRSLIWLLQQRINPERIIIINPEQAINAYRKSKRNALVLFEALFLRLAIRQKYWRQLFIVSQIPHFILRCQEIGLIQTYFESTEVDFDYSEEPEFFSLSNDDLDFLLATLLWWKHWTPTRVHSVLKKGAQQEGLLYYEVPPQESISQRLTDLQDRFKVPLIKQADYPSTQWTTTSRGRELLVWGFSSTQAQTLENIIQEQMASENQIQALFEYLSEPLKDCDASQRLIDWVKTHSMDCSLPLPLQKVIKELSYPIRLLDRFYYEQLNLRSQHFLQRMIRLLWRVDQTLRLFSRTTDLTQTEAVKKAKTPKQVCLRDVLRLIKRVGEPVTVSMVAKELYCNHGTTHHLLEKLARLKRFQKRIVIDGTSRRAYYATRFPTWFDAQCGKCHWFARNHCALWRTIKYYGGDTIPKSYRQRTWKLKPGSIGCEEFQPTVITRTMLYTNFVQKQEQLNGLKGKDRASPYMSCLECHTPLPWLHEGTERCSHCGTAYRLNRDQDEKIVVLNSPDFDQLLSEALQRWIGLPRFQRRKYNHQGQSFSIYHKDTVSLEDNRLMVQDGTSQIYFKISNLSFLRVHNCELPPSIITALEQAKVKIYHFSAESPETPPSPLLKEVIDFARQTEAFNRCLVKNSLLSRALLWNRQFSIEYKPYYDFLDAMVRLETETSRELAISYEGQAAAPLWDEIHTFAQMHGFPTWARIPERYVFDRGDRLAFGSCAYSSFHALVNGIFSAGYRACSQLAELAELVLRGISGVVHYRKSKSRVDTFGLQFDLSDILKPLLLNELLNRIKTGEFTPKDVWYFHGRRSEWIYYLSYQTQQQICDCVESVLNSPVSINGQVLCLRDAFLEFLKTFRQVLIEVYKDAMFQSYWFQGKYFNGVGLAKLREESPETLLDPQANREFQKLLKEVKQRAIHCAEQGLAPLILATTFEEGTIMQDILEVLEIVH